MANNGPYYQPGVYRCEISDHGLTKAQTGTVQVVLRFKVLEGINPQDGLQQYERTAYMPVTDRTMEYLIPKLQALGYTRDSLRHIDLNSPQCHDMRGQIAEMYCKHESGNDGVLREKWDVSTRSASAPLELKPPDPKELRNLDMLFGRQLKSAGVKPQTRASDSIATNEPPDLSEIPF